MSELSIVLTGEIQKSNFDEWKTDLIEQIRSVKTELVTDDDFAAASKHVKQFKKAEKSLKAAKESALDQAAEISNLFDAIDTVSEEARQARLKLDKQIKKRKQEIKDDFVTQGVDTIKAFIAEQSDAFQKISHSDYTNDANFEDALSGKASTKGMQKAINTVCAEIKEAITNKAAIADANAKTLDTLPANQQPLFQDRAQLLALTEEQLNKTIDDRVSKLSNAEVAADTAPAEPETEEQETEQAPAEAEKDDAGDKSDFTVTVEIHATEDDADAVRSLIVDALKSNTSIGNITLSAV